MVRKVLGLGRCAGLGCLGLLALGAPTRAEEAALNWVRLEGAEKCIDAPKLAALVEARIGRSVLQPPSRAELSIEAHVGPRPGGGFGVLVSVHDRTGTRIGQRELHVDRGPCSQLDRPASLIISLIIDPDAAGPGLMEAGALSQDAQHLLAQLDLPSADPDALLASLDFTPAPPRPDVLASSSQPSQRSSGAGARDRQSDGKPPAKLVTVRKDEWLRLQALRREQAASGASSALTPRWPGYALLGLSGAAAVTATFALVRLSTLNDDESFTTYRQAADPGVSDVCVAADQGRTFGLDPTVRARAVDVCDEASIMSPLFWASVGTTLASGAFGAAWLLWMADDEPAATARRPQLSLALSPSPAAAELRLQLRL